MSMHTQTGQRSVPGLAGGIGSTLEDRLSELVEQVTRSEPGVERSRLMRWLLLGLAVFAVWRAGRALHRMFWALFGIAMALSWTGAFRWWH